MGRKNKDNFWESAYMNNASYQYYYNKLTELAVSMFEWKNLPEGIDERFMELCLFGKGMAVFFYDEDLEQYLCLNCLINGPLDVYRIPIKRRAYAVNGYQKDLDNTNSVIIFNNYLHTTPIRDIELFAKRLYNIDRTMDVNVNAQKTPVLLIGDENQRLTLKNIYKEWQGNEPVIFGDKHLNKESIQSISTLAPFVSDKLQILKNELWNDALTYLGITSVNDNKKERLISTEVSKNLGGTYANRESRLQMRKKACEQINKMFGLNIDVEYRDATDEIYLDQEELKTGKERGDNDE